MNKDDIFDDIETQYTDENTEDNSQPQISKEKLPFDVFLYRNICILGIQTKRKALHLLKLMSRFFILPFSYIVSFFGTVFFGIGKLFKLLKKRVSKESADFHKDFLKARQYFKESRKTKKKVNYFSLTLRFIKLAFERHKTFLKHAFNYILPACLLIVLLVEINYYKDLNFALDVTYNNVNIGCIENEQVFREAKMILNERLSLGKAEGDINSIVSEPEYKIRIVSLDELSDSNEICEKIIENSENDLTTACGVYIDGKFICSVKNESDASSVFKNLINEYCLQNKINQNNSDVLVDIVEDVSYTQGLFSESTIMDSNQLAEYIKAHKKSKTSFYHIQKGDSPASISDNFGITPEQFYALNPTLNNEGEFKVGNTVTVISSTPYINISISKTEVETREIEYKTVEINTSSLYQGVKKTVTKGKNGEEIVTNLVEYVNGEVISKRKISSKVTVPAVDKQVYVGTKPVPSYAGVYSVNAGTFVWPAVDAHVVTSGFGYRVLYGKSNFHRGIDISGGGATGKPIIASAAGTVEEIRSERTGYGYSILINHGNGVKTRYAHLVYNSATVKVGDRVVQGQMIAQLGNSGNSTGPHLHFEIISNGANANPLDYLTR